jgi:hypothetical protein
VGSRARPRLLTPHITFIESRVWELGYPPVRYIKPYILFIDPRDWERPSPTNNMPCIGIPLYALTDKSWIPKWDRCGVAGEAQASNWSSATMRQPHETTALDWNPIGCFKRQKVGFRSRSSIGKSAMAAAFSKLRKGSNHKCYMHNTIMASKNPRAI